MNDKLMLVSVGIKLYSPPQTNHCVKIYKCIQVHLNVNTNGHLSILTPKLDWNTLLKSNDKM